jgi:hypothetical protein
MSLICFHIILISTTLIFFFGLGVWGVENFVRSNKILDLLTGIGSFAACVLFAYYLVWFVKKNRHLWKPSK